MMKLFGVALVAIMIMSGAVFGQNEMDLLSQALDSIGFTREDIGYQPKGYWTRFPNDVPYRLKSFDDLFAEPLKLYDFGKSFGEAMRIYCDPERLDSLDDNLYQLTFFLGVERKLGGMRSYGANLVEAPDSLKPFVRAVENIFLAAGEKTKFISFGQRYGFTDSIAELEELTETIPLEIRLLLGQLVENLREAYYWRDLGIRNISEDIRNKIFQIRDLSETQADGQKYYPELDDAAGLIDFESLFYGGLKAVAAAEQFEKAVSDLNLEFSEDFELDFDTPYGRIVINGTENNQIDGNNCFLIVDFGGDDNYTGSAGATSRYDRGVSVLIDLDGNDNYSTANSNDISFGAGILGIGVCYDVSGSDRYRGKVFSQGAGLFGIGILFDKEGVDDYKAETSAQGCGYFGIGLCIDAAGNDDYYLYGDGQGMGGIGGGIGILADYSGNDVYTAEPYSSVVDRGDYHSEHVINSNNAQGVGFGRRGDGSDGHSYAGGLGVIVDISGDDQYISGNWSLGCGYWFGTGICYDGEGDDLYKSVYFTQASGAHFCNAALIDEAGDDKHILYETAGAALAFGWDFTNALFIDRGGNDEYEAKMISYGLAQLRSFALFFEMGGADTYKYVEGQQGFGAASFRPDFAEPKLLNPYTYYAKSAGIFIDASGTDNYILRQDDKEAAAEIYQDNAIWFTLDKDNPNFGHNNFGIGIDADTGHIPELGVFDN
ncbi:MAG: hypothetical protein V3V99_14480 [candidate division Zixibacteria bacterium]